MLRAAIFLRNPAAAIYGDVTVGSIFAVETAQRETFAETLGAGLLALLMLWLAHAYAEDASRRWREGEAITLGGLRHSMADELSILLGAAIPILALIFTWIFGAGLGAAIYAATWVSVVTVVALEVLVGVRAKDARSSLGLRVLLGVFL